MTHRRAASLAELLVIMSACTIILTTSVQLIHRAMHSQSASRVFFDCERSAQRLSQQFRSDVHEATSGKIKDGAAGLVAVLRLHASRRPDRRISLYQRRYRAIGHSARQTHVVR